MATPNRLEVILGTNTGFVDLSVEERKILFDFLLDKLRPRLQYITPHTLDRVIARTVLSQQMDELLAAPGAISFSSPLQASDRMMILSRMKDAGCRYRWLLCTRDGSLVLFTCSFEKIAGETLVSPSSYRLISAVAQEATPEEMSNLIEEDKYLPINSLSSIQRRLTESMEQTKGRLSSQRELADNLRQIKRRLSGQD